MASSKNLNNDIIFNLLLWGGAVIASLCSVFISVNNELYFCLSVGCFNNISEIYSFPIKIFASGMALAAFRAMIFRSYQSQVQIDVSLNQNIFKNYIDHKKEFSNIIESIEDNSNFVIHDKEGLYSIVFPTNSPVNMNFVSKEIDSEQSCIEIYVKKFNSLINTYNELTYELLSNHSQEKSLAIWISRFVVFCVEIGIKFSEFELPNDGYNGFFGEEEFYMLVPKNIEDIGYQVSQYLKRLAKYSLPNKEFGVTLASMLPTNGQMNLLAANITKKDSVNLFEGY